MSAPSDEPATKRRKVRKGTHSCWECRRRKVKCTFASPDDVVCITCTRRGQSCVSQMVEVGGGTGTAEDDLVYTGGVVGLRGQSSREFGTAAQPERQDHAGVCTMSAYYAMAATPANTLQDGHEFGSKYSNLSIESPDIPTRPKFLPTPASSHGSISESSRHAKISQALVHTLPPKEDIKMILGKVSPVSWLCYQSHYKPREALRHGPRKAHVSLEELYNPDTHPLILAKHMLLLAASLQYLRPNEVIHGLSEDRHVLMDNLVDAVDRLVSGNDALVGTLECLELIALQIFFHTDNGNMRRAWMTARRAAMVAQLLGLHRPGQYRFKVIDERSDLEPELMAACIISVECSLSLLLGLPPSTNAWALTLSSTCTSDDEVLKLHTYMMGLKAKIIDRNETRNPQQALDKTAEIDRELLSVAEQMSAAFWRPPNFAGLAVDCEDAMWETIRTWDQMFYYTLLNQLHLPYLIRPEQVYSRMACVNASREILTREIAFRKFDPITACCRMGDFLALIAGMTLILAHIVSRCHKKIDNLLVHQRLSDRATVEQALDCMCSMSELREDVLAAKCAALLKRLLDVEADASRAKDYTAHEVSWTDRDDEDKSNVLVIKVPYVGAIRIAREGIVSLASGKARQDEQLQEGIMIGGIGSLHVNSPVQTESHNDIQVGGLTAVDARAHDSASGQDPSGHASNFVLDDDNRQDPMFPDVAAGIDDWAFQGFDTAFWDVLMRSAADQQPNGSTDERWGF